MNKKISTLMAGALLAGALVTPANVLAAIQYKAGTNYGNATGVTAASSSSKTGYMVFQDSDGNDYVVTVDANHAMVATPFADALLSTSVMTIDGTVSGNQGYSFAVNGITAGLAYGSGDWGNVATAFTGSSCALTNGSPFKIVYGTSFVKIGRAHV